MKRQKITWWVALAMLTFVVAVTAPAFPQETAPTEAAVVEDEAASKDAVEAILREHEEARSGPRFSYDPGNRRDPFRSLYDVIKDDEGARPPGVEGMSVDEIDLTGIVDADGGDVAYFTGSDNKGYFLRVGDRIYNATMIAIDLNNGTVTFRQKVDDPRQIKPYRDVVRRLVPLEGEQR